MPASKLQEQIKKKQPFDVPEEEAYLNLLRTHGVLYAEFHQLFKSAGISEPKYNVLRILRGAGPDGLPSLEVADRMITRLPDITRLVDRLEAENLVRRERSDEDRRVVRVKATQKGLDVLAGLDGPVGALHKSQLGHLSRAELAELSRLLEKARERPA